MSQSNNSTDLGDSQVEYPFIMVSADEATLLTVQVNQKLQQGYVLHGGMVVKGDRFYQAMQIIPKHYKPGTAEAFWHTVETECKVVKNTQPLTIIRDGEARLIVEIPMTQPDALMQLTARVHFGCLVQIADKVNEYHHQNTALRVRYNNGTSTPMPVHGVMPVDTNTRFVVSVPIDIPKMHDSPLQIKLMWAWYPTDFALHGARYWHSSTLTFEESIPTNTPAGFNSDEIGYDLTSTMKLGVFKGDAHDWVMVPVSLDMSKNKAYDLYMIMRNNGQTIISNSAGGNTAFRIQVAGRPVFFPKTGLLLRDEIASEVAVACPAEMIGGQLSFAWYPSGREVTKDDTWEHGRMEIYDPFKVDTRKTQYIAECYDLLVSIPLDTVPILEESKRLNLEVLIWYRVKGMDKSFTARLVSYQPCAQTTLFVQTATGALESFSEDGFDFTGNAVTGVYAFFDLSPVDYKDVVVESLSINWTTANSNDIAGWFKSITDVTRLTELDITEDNRIINKA